MPSFLTQCPHCLTSFRVTDKQLEAADGLVRCGACLGIFSAAANRITLKQTPDETAADADEFPGEVADDTEEDTFAGELADEADEAATEVEEVLAIEFVLPEEFEAEPAMAEEDAPEPDTAPEPEHAILDAEDFDIPLGDLNLDIDDLDEAEAEEEEEDAAFEDEDDDGMEEADDEYEEYADDDDEEEADEEEEEEEDYEEQYEDELADDDAYEDAEDDGEDEEDEEAQLVATPSPLPAAAQRLTTDKRELHRYLAEIDDEDALDPLDDEALDAFEEEPVVLDTAPRRSGFVAAALLLAGIFLILLLALQYTSANIERLSRSAGFVPFRPYVCGIVDCPAPRRSQLDQLVSEQLLVRSHPRYAQALEVNLVFRNDADAAQPFPAIELGFHDTDNRLVANRLFQPVEYLPAELRTSDMPAHSSIQATLEMVDPGSDAVNYTLVFREP